MERNNQNHKELSFIYRNIQYYQQMTVLSKDSYQRMFYLNLLDSEVMRLNHLRMQMPVKNIESNQREFTLEELAQYDGSGGRPAYVAVNGIVYDVSLEATWGGGTHFSLYAGRDLTEQFNGCHGGQLEVLRNLPQVGVLRV